MQNDRTYVQLHQFLYFFFLIAYEYIQKAKIRFFFNVLKLIKTSENFNIKPKYIVNEKKFKRRNKRKSHTTRTTRTNYIRRTTNSVRTPNKRTTSKSRNIRTGEPKVCARALTGSPWPNTPHTQNVERNISTQKRNDFLLFLSRYPYFFTKYG